ncbi:hypothetical protein BSKO_14033 [Bryopsis sp. KO-2023]|nr:hypothetical protein BSKO_14033 [Bryopsis sp. KO-2023]
MDAYSNYDDIAGQLMKPTNTPGPTAASKAKSWIDLIELFRRSVLGLRRVLSAESHATNSKASKVDNRSSSGARSAGSRTVSWVRSKLTCFGGSGVLDSPHVQGKTGTDLEGHRPTYDITDIVMRQRREILEATQAKRGELRIVQRQIEFLRSQLEAIQKTSEGEVEFMKAVDDLDGAIIGYQRLHHRLEQQEDERDILKRKVLSSRAAAEAMRAYQYDSGIEDEVRAKDRQAFTRLAYAGLLKEHQGR